MSIFFPQQPSVPSTPSAPVASATSTVGSITEGLAKFAKSHKVGLAVIGALSLLSLGGFVAYKKSETVRNGVNSLAGRVSHSAPVSFARSCGQRIAAAGSYCKDRMASAWNWLKGRFVSEQLPPVDSSSTHNNCEILDV